jgi:Sortase domain
MFVIRRSAAIALAAGLIGIVGGVLGLLLTQHWTPGMRPPPAGVAALPVPKGPVVAPPQPPQPLQPDLVARPVSLIIPLIGVRTRLITLGLTAHGAMQVPHSTTVAGWFTGSPRPGDIGSAVIVGHIDSLTGPGVFYRLSELRAGDRVYVRRADGTMAEFLVTAVRTYLKRLFPTEAVYGATPNAELRLITCGGEFDYATGHYLRNTVVYTNEVG